MKVDDRWRKLGWRHPHWDYVRFYTSFRKGTKQRDQWLAKLRESEFQVDTETSLNIPPGEYMAPRPASNEDMRSESFKEKMNRGPIFQINLMKPGPISLGRPLALWFIYLLVVAFVVAHVTAIAVGSATDTKVIFHTVALTSLMGSLKRPWR